MYMYNRLLKFIYIQPKNFAFKNNFIISLLTCLLFFHQMSDEH